MTSRIDLPRRRLLAAGAAAGALSTIPAMPALGQAKRTLTVQTLGGAIEKIMREEIVPAFQKEHNIDVTLVIEDDVTILPKLRAARNRPPYDVCTCDNPIAILGAEADVWAPDQTAKMSNAKDIYKSCKPPATSNYGSIIYEYACVYNTKKMKAPASWADLWADNVVVGVPHISQAYGLTFLYIAAILNGGNEKNLDPGFAAIKRLKNFKVYKSVSQGLTMFQQNEIDVALFYGHRGQQMIDMGLPIAKTVPKEGTWGQRTGTQIAKGTQKLDEATLWVNNTWSVPYQLAFTKGLYSPTNRNVVPPPELAPKLILGEKTVDAIKEAPWAVLLPQRDALLDKWTREFGG
jgi:putative spermidine/putrescine transport system substrate-binding protein